MKIPDICGAFPFEHQKTTVMNIDEILLQYVGPHVGMFMQIDMLIRSIDKSYFIKTAGVHVRSQSEKKKRGSTNSGLSHPGSRDGWRSMPKPFQEGTNGAHPLLLGGKAMGVLKSF